MAAVWIVYAPRRVRGCVRRVGTGEEENPGRSPDKVHRKGCLWSGRWGVSHRAITYGVTWRQRKGFAAVGLVGLSQSDSTIPTGRPSKVRNVWKGGILSTIILPKSRQASRIEGEGGVNSLCLSSTSGWRTTEVSLRSWSANVWPRVHSIDVGCIVSQAQNTSGFCREIALTVHLFYLFSEPGTWK